jgi:hypothetical protein
MFGTLMTSSRLRAGLLVSALALAGAAGSAFASSPYDGNWSVIITTRAGACDPTSRYRLQITNGVVVNGNSNDIDVSGKVSRDGNVSVSVHSGDAGATAIGHLSGDTGSGTWKGHGSNGECEGTWVAERRAGSASATPKPATLGS